MSNSRSVLIKKYFEAMVETHRLLGAIKETCWSEKSLPLAQLQILAFIHRHHQPSVKNIVKTFSISSSAATQLIDSLAVSGLVDRQTSPNDHRATILSVSPAGEQRLKQTKQEMYQLAGQLFDGLSDQDLRNYLDINRSVITNLEKIRKDKINGS